MPASSSLLADLVAAVHDEMSLLDLLKTGLGWPILSLDNATRRQPQIADGIDFAGGDVSVRRLRPTSGEDARPVFIVDFEGAGYLRRDLRALLRSVKGFERETAGVGATGVGDTLYVVAQEDWRDVRFVLFRPRPSGAPEIRSFGWRDGKPGRTVLETNLPGLLWARREAWQEAFNVEGLTEAFYEAFRRDFDAIKSEIVIQKMAGEVEANDARNEARRHEWTQLLFNRLLFVAFVERMGWFGLPGGAGPGGSGVIHHAPEGERDESRRYKETDYLHALYRAPRGTFQTYLGMLRCVFEELDTPDDAPHKGARRAEIGTVPYLNGGLFAPDGIDANEIELSDESFERILGGPDALFRRYNFTVTESSPLDQEVAVDPEMLGKIFERLVNDRHAEGKYYTPRPIVGFMVDEAIKGYLVEGGLSPEKAALLVEEERLRAEDGGVHLDADEVGPIRERLMAVRAVDPACGSGAYLLGLLQKTFNLVDLLNLGSRTGRDLYRTKLALLQRCIYGVDLDPTAVRIARLRLWLSLTVENPGGYKPEPLPNLDFRIEAGDSLACPVAPLQPDMFRDRIIRDFRDAKLAYAGARPEERPALKARALALRDELRLDLAHATPLMAASRNPFDWTVEFAEVFGGMEEPPSSGGSSRRGGQGGEATGGFDIVLANPPYVNFIELKQADEQYKSALLGQYPEVSNGRADLLVFFFARANTLLRENGQLAFITSNAWLNAGYGVKLRRMLQGTFALRHLIDFNDGKVFQDVEAYPLVTIASKGRGVGEQNLLYTDVPKPERDTKEPAVDNLVSRFGVVVPEALIPDDGRWRLKQSAEYQAGRVAQFIPLGQYVSLKAQLGVSTGLNAVYVARNGVRHKKRKDAGSGARKAGVFVITPEQFEQHLQDNPGTAEIIKPVYEGEHISRWHLDAPQAYLIYTLPSTNIEQFLSVKKHLEENQTHLEERVSSNSWYVLKQPQANYAARYHEAKIIFPDMASPARFALDLSGAYILNSAYSLPTGDLFLLGVLNSRPGNELYRAVTKQMIGGASRFMTQYVDQFPIPDATPPQRAEIEGLVRTILDRKATDPLADVGDLEAEIDRRVETLYFGEDQSGGR